MAGNTIHLAVQAEEPMTAHRGKGQAASGVAFSPASQALRGELPPHVHNSVMNKPNLRSLHRLPGCAGPDSYPPALEPGGNMPGYRLPLHP